MPPEPLSWDRNRDSKKHHERSSSGAGASDGVRSVARWRDSHHSTSSSGPPPPREFGFGGGRWDDFRSSTGSRSQGHGKQGGGYQLLFSEDSGHHGGMPFRGSSDRMILGDDNSFRPSSVAARSVGGGNGKYYGRVSRGSFNHRDFKGAYIWDADATSVRHHHDMTTSTMNTATAQRSVSDLLTYASHPQSDNVNCSSWNNFRPKDENDKLLIVDALDTDHSRYDKEHSLGPIGWKPLKWNRSSSLSSRGSGFSHTSSSKSLGADSDETKPDLPAGRLTPAQSLSGDAAPGDAPDSAPFEDTCSRKKQRLGWGQGLAKYEKQKVEGTDETVSRSGLVPCSTAAKQSQSAPSVPDKCHSVAFPSECPSPVTTSSVACSSSPGVDDKPNIRAANNDPDTCNLSGSPAQVTHDFRSCLEEFSASLEHLSSGTKLNSLLSDLLQLEDASCGDSDLVKSTAMNKLLLVKSELSKALEKTESEIDLFENELKLLNSQSAGPCSVTSDSLHVGIFSKVRENPIPSQMVSSTDMHVDMPELCNEGLEGIRGEGKDDDIDSPGTATSKFIEPSCTEKAVAAYSVGKHDGCSRDVVAARHAYSEQPCSSSFYQEEPASISSRDDGNHLVESSISLHALSDLKPDHNFIDLVLVSNRKSARKALDVFSKLLPADRMEVDIWGTCSLSWQNNKPLVRQKLAARKCFQRFKERFLTLKFRAFQRLWIEDMRLLSIRKHKAKSQKRIESSSRTGHIVYQKHRSSIRTRFTSPGNLPTPEVVDLTCKLLLSDSSQIKRYRDTLKMPALVEEKEIRFVSKNGLVEDPCGVERERGMINPWTCSEKEIFLEKLALVGKDFKKIASFLEQKTTADCVEFYYKNHKSNESFAKIKKAAKKDKEKLGLPTNTTYLMTTGKRWNNPALEIEKSSSCDIVEMEREATAADTLATFCGAISSEAMSSCVTSSVDLKNNSNYSLAVDEDEEEEEEETCSDDTCGGDMDSVDWTDDEKSDFLRALRCYGKDFGKIERCVRSRSRDQCKVFFSKARKSLALDVIHLEETREREGTPRSSGTEDNGVLETESGICSTQSCSGEKKKNGTEELNHVEKSGENNGVEEEEEEEEEEEDKCDKQQQQPVENVVPEAAADTAVIYDVPVMLEVDPDFTCSTESGRREQVAVPDLDLASFEGPAVVHSISEVRPRLPQNPMESLDSVEKALAVWKHKENVKSPPTVPVAVSSCLFPAPAPSSYPRYLLDPNSQILRGYPLQNFQPGLVMQCEESSSSSSSHRRVRSHSSGNVKLFGQILSHPSTENDKAVSSPFGFPARSYGFWDGSRIQTGSIPPDPSAITMRRSNYDNDMLYPSYGVSDPVAAIKMHYAQNGTR